MPQALFMRVGRAVENFPVLTFPSEVGILLAEGFGANTSERLAAVAEKEGALITFFFCTSSRSYRYDLPSVSFRIRSVPP